MQQRIRRVTTSQGREVAFASVGSGRPLVYVAGWLSHLELSWELPDERAFLEGLARGRRLIRYDRIGSGLSTRDEEPPTMEQELDQLGAVVATLGSEPFDLIGSSMGALVAVEWAVRHPETVRRLVLYGGWAHGAEISPASAQQNVLGLVESHWGLGSDVLIDIFAPDATSAARREFGRYQRGCSSAATASGILKLSYSLDVRGRLDDVRAPTLVVHRDRDRAVPLAQAEALAAGIPGAQLIVLPGRSHLPYIGDSRELITVIRRFLGLRVARRGERELTARQLEVAALIADGLTNRDIASRLAITERSAEGHVERIRLRLGFRSRAQIAAWYTAEREVG